MPDEMRRYVIRVTGFDAFELLAPSAAKAKWSAFTSWDDAGYGRSFYERNRQSDRFKRFLNQIEVCHAMGGDHA